MVTIDVKGYKEAKAILDELPNQLQKRILMMALRSSAKPMLQSARSHVPTRSGTLRKQLKVVAFRDRKAARNEVAVAVKPVFSINKRKGNANVYYGKFIHEGTKDPRTSRKGKKLMVFNDASGKKVFVRSTKGIKANPYLSKAYQSTHTQTVAIFGDELATAVSKFVGKHFKPVRR